MAFQPLGYVEASGNSNGGGVSLADATSKGDNNNGKGDDDDDKGRGSGEGNEPHSGSALCKKNFVYSRSDEPRYTRAASDGAAEAAPPRKERNPALAGS